MSVERKINYAGEKNKPKEMTFPEEKKQSDQNTNETNLTISTNQSYFHA